jgi:formate dehydrogenase maturation protein FdhE
MDNQLKDLLENEVLGPDVKKALQEAFNSKIKETEAKLQEAYASRYEHDKSTLVEAMDNMLSDAIKAELSEFSEDRTALISQKAKLSKATLSAKKVYEAKLSQHVNKLNAFMNKQIKEEISEFTADRKRLEAQRKKMAGELQAIKENSKKQVASRVNKLEEFVIKNLSEEIAEFQQDKKSLVEQRVKLAAEGKQKITETRGKFVQKATKLIDKTLNEVIRKELTQWRGDIKVARENNFGRRIFEAVAAEYMGSYLSEGSEIKKLQKILSNTKHKLNEAKAETLKSAKLIEQAEIKAKLANDKATRLETLSELLAPLSREKKAVMGEMLKDIKTSNLREAFNRYLNAVLNGNNVSSNTGKATLSENANTNAHSKSVGMTGDRKTKLNETATDESFASNSDIASILHLAGINKV